VETRDRTSLRLLDAIGHLAVQEAAQLWAGDFRGAADTRQRAEPLLRSLGAQPGTDNERVLARARSVLAARRQTEEWLERELAATRSSLDRIDSAHQRLARIAPAYCGSGAGVVPHLCLRG
jgi:hypothetical protein